MVFGMGGFHLRVRRMAEETKAVAEARGTRVAEVGGTDGATKDLHEMIERGSADHWSL